MEQKNLWTINELIGQVKSELKNNGHFMIEDEYKEIETIIFLALITKDNNNRLNLTKEANIDRYFGSKKIVSGIDLSVIKQNIIIYGNKIDELYCELIKLSNDELACLFESVHQKKIDECGRYSCQSTTLKELAELVFALCPRENNRSIIDICSGDGTLLTEAAKNGYKKLAGYEINVDNANLSKMRGAMQGKEYDIKMCDVLQECLEDKYDFVVSQPPFSLRTFQATVKDKDETFKYSERERIIRADWHFVFKALNSTKENGKTVIIGAAGMLFNTPDRFYRKQIIENRRLETVIKLPSGVIPGTGISAYILIFSEDNLSIEFVDASDCFIKTNGYLKKLDVSAVLALLEGKPKDKYIKIKTSNIETENYSLEVGRYLDTKPKIQLKNPQQVKSHAEVIPGFQYTTRNVKELLPGEGPISVVKITNIINGSIDYENLASIDVDEKKIEKYLLKENDILVSTKGTAVKFAIVENIKNKKLVPHSNMTVIRCNKELEPLYLISFLKSETGMAMFKAIQTGAIIMNITQKAIENFEFPMIESDKQKEIASRYKTINKKISDIKSNLALAERKLETLWEDETNHLS